MNNDMDKSLVSHPDGKSAQQEREEQFSKHRVSDPATGRTVRGAGSIRAITREAEERKKRDARYANSKVVKQFPDGQRHIRPEKKKR